MDILQEILSEPKRDNLDAAQLRSRDAAEAAQRLYQEAVKVCEKFGFPFDAIRVEVWSRGSDKKQPLQDLYRIEAFTPLAATSRKTINDSDEGDE